MKKQKILRIVALIILLVGVLILLVPQISKFIYKRDVDKIIISFEEDIKKIENKYDNNAEDNQLDKLYERLKLENEQLYKSNQSDLVDPFSYSQPTINLDEYGLSDNIIGYIQIEKMDIKLPIYLGANVDNMKKGAVHLTQTSYPIGGNNTNSVIAAHRDTTTKLMFNKINLLSEGDDVYVVNFRETLHYKVVGYKIIKPNESDEIKIKSDKDMITLITCHPYGYNYQRYLVFCERAD